MKYKLIKEYPGSPRLGTIRYDKDKIQWWEPIVLCCFYPEFWEEVEELDFDKPCLSLNDLLSVWGSVFSEDIEFYKGSPLFKSFMDLAKSKS